MTDLVPKATAIAVDLAGPTAGRLTPDWHNAIRRAIQTLQRRTEVIAAQQAQLTALLEALQGEDGELIDVAQAIADKQNHSALLDQLSHLAEVGFVERVGSGYATRYPDAIDITYDNTASGLAAATSQAAIDELAAGSGGGTSTTDIRDVWLMG